MKGSTHFKRYEVVCKCGECRKFSADVELVHILDNDVREYYDCPTIIHSWYRCLAHNNRPSNQRNSSGVLGAGSNSFSWHPTGGAADFHVEKSGILLPPKIVYDRLDQLYPDRYGLGLYDWGVHLDIRPVRARWRG